MRRRVPNGCNCPSTELILGDTCSTRQGGRVLSRLTGPGMVLRSPDRLVKWRLAYARRCSRPKRILIFPICSRLDELQRPRRLHQAQRCLLDEDTARSSQNVQAARADATASTNETPEFAAVVNNDARKHFAVRASVGGGLSAEAAVAKCPRDMPSLSTPFAVMSDYICRLCMELQKIGAALTCSDAVQSGHRGRRHSNLVAN
jgi:hypothetical protein